MSPTKRIETPEQLFAMMGDLRRMRILEILTERQASVKELATLIKESPQTTHYHTKLLEKAGLIEIVEKREVRGALEKFYRAVADRFEVVDSVGKGLLDEPEMGFEMLRNFLELGRWGAAEAGMEGVQVNALIVHTDPARAKEFQQRLSALVQEFHALEEEGGQRFGLMAALFPVSMDAPLPEHPEIFTQTSE